MLLKNQVIYVFLVFSIFLYSLHPMIGGSTTYTSSYLLMDNTLIDPMNDGNLLMAPSFNHKLQQMLISDGENVSYSLFLDVLYNNDIQSRITEEWLTGSYTKYKNGLIEDIDLIIDRIAFTIEAGSMKAVLGDGMGQLSKLSFANKEIRGAIYSQDLGIVGINALGGYSEQEQKTVPEIETNESLFDTNDIDGNGYLNNPAIPKHRRYAFGGNIYGAPFEVYSFKINGMFELDQKDDLLPTETEQVPPIKKVIYSLVNDFSLFGDSLTITSEEALSQIDMDTTITADDADMKMRFGTVNSIGYSLQSLKLSGEVRYADEEFITGGDDFYTDTDRLVLGLGVSYETENAGTPGIRYTFFKDDVDASSPDLITHEIITRYNIELFSAIPSLFELYTLIKTDKLDNKILARFKNIDIAITELSTGAAFKLSQNTKDTGESFWNVEGLISTKNSFANRKYMINTQHKVGYKQKDNAYTMLSWTSGLFLNLAILEKLQNSTGFDVQLVNEKKTLLYDESSILLLTGTANFVYTITPFLQTGIEYKPVIYSITQDAAKDTRSSYNAHMVSAFVSYLY
ncbi:hypothetical protein ACFL6D_00895 [Spirochaetota bacterium]